MATVTRNSTCPYCGVGCGVTVEVDENDIIAVSGDVDHPANFGNLCVKGSNLHKTSMTQGRLLKPRVNGAAASWDEALDEVAARFRQAVADHGPESVAFYLSGQLLTEDYYVANKLMKGFIGSGNVDTNSRLCMSSAVAGHKRAFGEDVVPCDYDDLERCDLIVLCGSNTAWSHPIVYQRIVAAREKHGTRVVVIDPRRTSTCEVADQHLALRPGSDSALFNGLLSYLAEQQCLNPDYIDRSTTGFAEALDAASLSIDEVAALTGLACNEIEAFYQRFAQTPNTVTLFSQGINQSSSGTDKANAIINCHLATGRNRPRGGQDRFPSPGNPMPWVGGKWAGWRTSWRHIRTSSPRPLIAWAASGARRTWRRRRA